MKVPEEPPWSSRKGNRGEIRLGFLFSGDIDMANPNTAARVAARFTESNPRWTITAPDVAQVLRECEVNAVHVTFTSDPWDHVICFEALVAGGTTVRGTVTIKARHTADTITVHGEVEYEPADPTP
jgi:hypothetical protein